MSGVIFTKPPLSPTKEFMLVRVVEEISFDYVAMIHLPSVSALKAETELFLCLEIVEIATFQVKLT